MRGLAILADEESLSPADNLVESGGLDQGSDPEVEPERLLQLEPPIAVGNRHEQATVGAASRRTVAERGQSISAMCSKTSDAISTVISRA